MILLRVCLVAVAVVLAAPVAAQTVPPVDVDNLLACGNSPSSPFVEYMQSRKVAPMLASTGVQYEDVVCRYRKNALVDILRLSDRCPACGPSINLCIAEAECRSKGSGYLTGITLVCLTVNDTSCPDATACFNDGRVDAFEAEDIVDITPQDERDGIDNAGRR